MARTTVEDCLENVDNRFELVMLASKRARQLATGGKEPKVAWENDKPTVVALREVVRLPWVMMQWCRSITTNLLFWHCVKLPQVWLIALFLLKPQLVNMPKKAWSAMKSCKAKSNLP